MLDEWEKNTAKLTNAMEKRRGFCEFSQQSPNCYAFELIARYRKTRSNNNCRDQLSKVLRKYASEKKR